jgi:hypothetical protein
VLPSPGAARRHASALITRRHYVVGPRAKCPAARAKCPGARDLGPVAARCIRDEAARRGNIRAAPPQVTGTAVWGPLVIGWDPLVIGWGPLIIG